MSVDHYREVIYKGDNLRGILTKVQSENETLYNFKNKELAYTETNNLE